MTVVELVDPDERTRTCRTLLRSLREWFGTEEAIKSCERRIRDLPTFRCR